MRDVLPSDLPGESADRADEEDAFLEDSDGDEDAPWRESLSDAVRDDESLETKIDHHPLQQQSQNLILRLHHLLAPLDDCPNTYLDLLHRGAGDLMGGLAQALGSSDWQPPPELAVPQLKRALAEPPTARGPPLVACGGDRERRNLQRVARHAKDARTPGALDELRPVPRSRRRITLSWQWKRGVVTSFENNEVGR